MVKNVPSLEHWKHNYFLTLYIMVARFFLLERYAYIYTKLPKEPIYVRVECFIHVTRCVFKISGIVLTTTENFGNAFTIWTITGDIDHVGFETQSKLSYRKQKERSGRKFSRCFTFFSYRRDTRFTYGWRFRTFSTKETYTKINKNRKTEKKKKMSNFQRIVDECVFSFCFSCSRRTR